MDINKAIRKQKKSYKRFLLSMCFIFVLLLVVFILSEKFTMFFWAYLLSVEGLIFIAILLRGNEELLIFKTEQYKISIWCGLMKKKYTLFCDKVTLVHTKGTEKNFEIVILTKSNFRNKRIRPVDMEFLKVYPYVGHIYNKLKKDAPEKRYFYLVIKKGFFKKYILLDELYKNCVQAIFTEDAIEMIKRYRK